MLRSLFAGLVLGAVAFPLAPAAMAAEQTTITVRVSGCEGCTIQPGQWRDASGEPWNGKKGVVRGGTVTLTVPTARTAGMAFTITAPWAVDQNAAQNVVVQYSGVQPGKTPTRAQIRKAKQATACWAGTTMNRARLAIRVQRIQIEAFPPGSGRGPYPLAYMLRSPQSPGGFSDVAIPGVIGNQQGGWLCT
jgi:type 1 fimbria pilin